MFEPFGIAINKVKRKYGGLSQPGKDIFYDLGSGTGKPIFAGIVILQLSILYATMNACMYWYTITSICG